MKRKDHRVPIYCIQTRGSSNDMLEEVKEKFNLNLELFEPLSRCVKCNGDDLEEIEKEEAFKTIVFKYEDTVEEFWRCKQCKQIYWEGKQF